MSQIKIDKLTPEQEALIPVYREKWRKIALSTERIDRDKAAEAVKAVYAAIELEEPEIIFFESPNLALNYFEKRICDFQTIDLKISRQDNPIHPDLYRCSWDDIINKQNYFEKKDISLLDCFHIYLKNKIQDYLYEYLFVRLNIDNSYLFELSMQLDYIDTNIIILPFWCQYLCFLDFSISVLCCDYFLEEWAILKLLIKHCDWIYPCQDICGISDRPTKISFDDRNFLHAEGKPAIQYADGFSLYSYHGVTLPEKYGRIHPERWRSNWLLEEENAELRRVLIQGIGYTRICQELEATKLNSWQEYTLLKIDADIDGFDPNEFVDEENLEEIEAENIPKKESIYLLKMTCPSTGHIHALRVPPEMQTAREAIQWVNWGIDPEEFFIQT
ncbi:MAG: DUF6745 domain-containing protein [Xenococcaceae cyanobacterium]